MSLTKQEVDIAVEKALGSLDEVVGGAPSGPAIIESYFDKVGVHNIKGGGVKKRIVRKILAPSAAVLKKIFQGYLEERTRVDNSIRDSLYLQQREIAQLQNDLKELLHRDAYETQKLVDGFKQEIIAELVDIKPKQAHDSKTKIINADRVNKLKKLNIGSGRDIRDDYINVDHRQIKGVDLVADVKDLPFKPGTLEEIFASHVVEHFTERDAKKILAYWFTLLKKGGALRVIVPNIDAMARGYANNTVTWEQFHAVVLGAQDYESDHHFNQFSLESMEALVKHAIPEGSFNIVEGARRNGESLEMEVVIRK